MEYRSESPKKTETVAATLVRRWRPGTVVLLIGRFGAGKTTFVRGVLRGLGYRGRVVSPSFLIRKTYHLRQKPVARSQSPILRVHHLDGYRLKHRSELAALGLDEVLADRESLTFVEWPHRFSPSFRNRRRIVVRLRAAGKERRRITVSRVGPKRPT